MHMLQYMPHADCIISFRQKSLEHPGRHQAGIMVCHGKFTGFGIWFNTLALPSVFIHILNKGACACSDIQVVAHFQSGELFYLAKFD